MKTIREKGNNTKYQVKIVKFTYVNISIYKELNY